MSEWIDPQLSVLPPPQRRLWPELSELPRHFVLYGGTGLALRVGGRQSEDFDLFTTEPVNAHELARSIRWLTGAELIQAAPNTATWLVDRGGPVRVSCFGSLTFGRVGDASLSRDNHLQIASLLDLSAQKVRTIQVRALKKDYLDLATLIRNGISLEQALGAARGLFPDFAPLVSLKALSYFGDGDLAELPEDIRQFLSHSAAAVREIPSIPRRADRLSG